MVTFCFEAPDAKNTICFNLDLYFGVYLNFAQKKCSKHLGRKHKYLQAYIKMTLKTHSFTSICFYEFFFTYLIKPY